MSWLLFCDESGHDHKNTPLEVRGGIAIKTNKIWDFVQAFAEAEKDIFGVKLSEYSSEIKGNKLLKKDRFKWANQENKLEQKERHNGVKRFLSKQKSNSQKPTKRDFTSYGQACLMMVDSIFDLLERFDATLFASCIPCGVKQNEGMKFKDFLRKDHVFLQERFYWFLEEKKEPGLFIMDQTEANNDQRYISRLEGYYTKTSNGKKRAKWIVPSPIFVDSGLTPCIQAADICLYCINWGFRRKEWKFKGNQRDDIHKRFSSRCENLQYYGDMVINHRTIKGYGIIFVPDPYTPRSKAR